MVAITGSWLAFLVFMLSRSGDLREQLPVSELNTLTPEMNTNVFITDRCELSSLGPVAAVAGPAFGWTSPPKKKGGLNNDLHTGRPWKVSPTNRINY